MSKQKIRIGFDAKRVFQNFTGLGNYSRTLLSTLAQFCPEYELHLFAPKKNETVRTQTFLQAPFHAHFTKSFFPSYWRSKSVVNDLLKNNIQIYHGLSHELPIGIEKTNIKTVVTIHDLVLKRYPKLFKPIDRWIYDRKFCSACERADIVVAISESTKNDIIKYYNIPATKIQVIYQSIDQQFWDGLDDQKSEEVKNKFNLPNDYFLYVGSVIPRKKLGLIVEAYQLIGDDTFPPLMIVGKGGLYRREVEDFVSANKLSDQIRFLDQSNFEDLPALYANAIALCYPSIYEGFGLPLTESLAMKRPVITYRGSSLPEAAGPGALYLEELSASAIKDSFLKIAKDEQLQARLVKEGNQYVQQFRASDVSKQWRALYDSLV